jgi:hypothetical protein
MLKAHLARNFDEGSRRNKKIMLGIEDIDEVEYENC